MVFGVEAGLPIEIQLPSLRVAVHEEMNTEEKANMHLAKLEALMRIFSQLTKFELYRHWMSNAFNKGVGFGVSRKGIWSKQSLPL